MFSKLGINDTTFFTEIPDSELQNISGGKGLSLNKIKQGFQNAIKTLEPLGPCAIGAVAGPAVGVDPVTGCLIADTVAKD
ncbi:bacteriocin [Nostoc sp. FACHB-892]|uniref:bacteriocin n=1 Tax=Nostoc sp. FACHB-892 TaxID=2692843 RepID=UPI001689CDDB|nr:bacteriocin [Nostoc sp. FACHB-892]MBD2730729.1 bacteriocin [Nostoc sp. FACHB-892]